VEATRHSAPDLVQAVLIGALDFLLETRKCGKYVSLTREQERGEVYDPRSVIFSAGIEMYNWEFMSKAEASLALALIGHRRVRIREAAAELIKLMPGIWPENIVVRAVRRFTRGEMKVSTYVDVYDSPASAKLEFEERRGKCGPDYWLEDPDVLFACNLPLPEDIGEDRYARRMASQKKRCVSSSISLRFLNGNLTLLIEIKAPFGTQDLNFKPVAEQIARHHLRRKVRNPGSDKGVLRLIPTADELGEGFTMLGEKIIRFGADGRPIKD
jgi:hypothetical protein